jgi:branched-chain amino acid transport system substrate-binding protein
MKRLSILIVVLLIAALAMSACATPTAAPAATAAAATTAAPAGATVAATEAAKPDIVIGNLQDESGGMKALSIVLTYAAQMKIDEINAAGGINGRKIKMITYDTQSDVNQAINAYHRLVEQDKVVAVFGPPVSNIGIALAPVAEQLKVPIVGLFMDDNAIIQPNGNPWTYMFLGQDSAAIQGKTIAAYTVNELKAKKIAVLYNLQNSYSVALANAFDSLVLAQGGTIVDQETYTTTDKDFHAQLTKMKAANPEAIYFPSYPVEIPLIYEQAYELGITVPMIGSNSVPPTGLAPQTDPAATTNTFYPYGINPSDPQLADWSAKYKALYNAAPIAQSYSGADAFGILVQAITACGDTVTSECITQQVSEVKDYQGFQGKITMSPTKHQPDSLPMAIMTIADGQPKFVEFYTPEGPVK